MFDFKALFEDGEIGEIDRFFDDAGRRHPAWTAIHANDGHVDYERSPKDYLVNQAAEQISESDDGANWLLATKKRIVQVSDFEECASALAEIRCFGALLEAGFGVTPVPTKKTPTPDFQYQLGEHTGVVEVATKLEHADQVDRARKIIAGETLEGVERSKYKTSAGTVEMTIAEMHPFGAPVPDKEGDTTQTNAISRICAIKGKETQIFDGMPGILWVDFRDLGKWPGLLNVEDTSPLVSGHGGSLTSGPFWYGFYGWKGAPVFEGHNSNTPMGHYGRFHPDAPRRSAYSAALICLDKATVLFENPSATERLPGSVRKALARVPWFDISHSIAEWKDGNVEETNKLARAMIDVLSTN